MEGNKKQVQRSSKDENSTNMEPKPRRFHLYLSVIILNIIYLAVGTAFAWSSPMLMKLDLTPDESSTVASVLPLGGMLGPFVSGLVVDRLGRKNTAALNMGFMTCSFLLLTFSRNVTILSIGRFMSGMSWGLTFSSLPMYIAEISEDSVRGVLNTMSMISIASGSLLMYAVGPFVSYELIHYILLGICALFYILFPLLPNSPYAFVMNNQVNSARTTLIWLREKRAMSCVEKELQDIQKVVTKNETESGGSIKELFTSRGNRRALTVCCTLISLQQLSGITVVLFYVQQIFHSTASTISSSTCSIIIGLVKLAAGFVCPVAVKSFGYKKPMIVSTFGSALGVGGLGVFFFLKNHGFNVDSLNWLPLLSVVLYIFAFISAFATVPWALSGELFPGSVKPKATTTITMTKAFLSFLTVKMYPHLSRLLGIDFLCLGFALFCCLAMVFVTAAVPDTSGMSFIEIQEMLNGHKKKEILLVEEK